MAGHDREGEEALLAAGEEGDGDLSGEITGDILLPTALVLGFILSHPSKTVQFSKS